MPHQSPGRPMHRNNNQPTSFGPFRRLIAGRRLSNLKALGALLLGPALLASPAAAQKVNAERTVAPAPENLVVSEGKGKYRIGEVTIDTDRKELSFPSKVNMLEEVIEYAIVGKTGKLHESLLATEVVPTRIHLAMLLLGKKDLWPGSDVTGLPGGQPIEVTIAWTEQDQERTARIEDWIVVGEEQLPASRGLWVYNGSRIAQGRFTADVNQSILSLIVDRDALANNPRTGHENDDIWFPAEAKIPPVGTPVQVTFRLLAQNEIPDPQADQFRITPPKFPDASRPANDAGPPSNSPAPGDQEVPPANRKN